MLPVIRRLSHNLPIAYKISPQFSLKMSSSSTSNGDLNNTSSMRHAEKVAFDPSFAYQSLAIPASEDDPTIRSTYRPFLLNDSVTNTDWVSRLELATATEMAKKDFEKTGERLRVLVLYGSLRKRSYSKLLAYEIARVMWRLGCDVRIFNPEGLPVKDEVQQDHVKVQELRGLSRWSDGHFWISPGMSFVIL